MIRRPPRSTRTDTLFPYTTLFRAAYTSSRNYGQDTPDPNNPAQIPADYDIANRFSTLKGYGLFNGRITANLDNGIELRSEEHTSELQSLMRISYAVFCLKKKTDHANYKLHIDHHIAYAQIQF